MFIKYIFNLNIQYTTQKAITDDCNIMTTEKLNTYPKKLWCHSVVYYAKIHLIV